ncbi:MAG: hypothetical protein JWR21_1762 [Herminiimonas sp.]|nr:hypothetical protein [Herminiimonas sp.]
MVVIGLIHKIAGQCYGDGQKRGLAMGQRRNVCGDKHATDQDSDLTAFWSHHRFYQMLVDLASLALWFCVDNAPQPNLTRGRVSLAALAST